MDPVVHGLIHVQDSARPLLVSAKPLFQALVLPLPLPLPLALPLLPPGAGGLPLFVHVPLLHLDTDGGGLPLFVHDTDRSLLRRRTCY